MWHYSKVISRTSLKVIKIANDVCFWANLGNLFWNRKWSWEPLEMFGKTRGRCWRCSGEDRESIHPLWIRRSPYSESRNQLQTQALNINAPYLKSKKELLRGVRVTRLGLSINKPGHNYTAQAILKQRALKRRGTVFRAKNYFFKSLGKLLISKLNLLVWHFHADIAFSPLQNPNRLTGL